MEGSVMGSKRLTPTMAMIFIQTKTYKTNQLAIDYVQVGDA